MATVITAAETLRRLEKELKDLTDTYGEVAEEQPKPFLDQIRKQLHDQGVNREGKKLTKYKSPAYARKKHQQNPLPGEGNPDLYLTGEFQSSLVLDVRGNDLVFGSTDSKAPGLEKKYGSEIFGYTPESREELRPVLVQGAAKKIKNRNGWK